MSWSVPIILIVLMVLAGKWTWIRNVFWSAEERLEKLWQYVHDYAARHPTLVLTALWTGLFAVPMRNSCAWPWSVITTKDSLENPPTGRMVGAALALVTLLTFAASTAGSLARDQGTAKTYLGRNMQTHAYAHSFLTSSLSTKWFQVLVGWLFIAPIFLGNVALMAGTSRTHACVRFALAATWTSAFAVISSVLALNLMRILRISMQQISWMGWARAHISQSVRLRYRRQYRNLLQHTDRFEAEGFSRALTEEQLELLTDLPTDEQHDLLRMTLENPYRRLDLERSIQRIITAHQHSLGWLRWINVRRAPAATILNVVTEGRREPLQSTLRNTALPETTRNSLLAVALEDTEQIDSMIQDLEQNIPGFLDSKAASDLTDTHDALRWKRAFTAQREDTSPLLEAVPFRTYHDLATAINPGHGPCLLTMEQLRMIITSQLVAGPPPADEGKDAQIRRETILAIRSIIIDAIIRTTITERHEDEQLPRETLRTLMGWERYIDHDGLDKAITSGVMTLEASIYSHVQTVLQTTPRMTSEGRAELLHYSTTTSTLTSLLFTLVYDGQGGHVIDAPGAASFYSALTRQRYVAETIPAGAVTHATDLLGRSLTRGMVTHSGIRWLFASLTDALTADTFSALRREQAAGLDLSPVHLCLWWALSRRQVGFRDIDVAKIPTEMDENETQRSLGALEQAASVLEETGIEDLV